MVLILNLFLFQARALISKVTEERNSIVEQNRRLQQELVWNSFWKKNLLSMLLHVLCWMFLLPTSYRSWLFTCYVMHLLGWTEFNILLIMSEFTVWERGVHLSHVFMNQSVSEYLKILADFEWLRIRKIEAGKLKGTCSVCCF